MALVEREGLLEGIGSTGEGGGAMESRLIVIQRQLLWPVSDH